MHTDPLKKTCSHVYFLNHVSFCHTSASAGLQGADSSPCSHHPPHQLLLVCQLHPRWDSHHAGARLLRLPPRGEPPQSSHRSASHSDHCDTLAADQWGFSREYEWVKRERNKKNMLTSFLIWKSFLPYQTVKFFFNWLHAALLLSLNNDNPMRAVKFPSR